MYKCDFCGKDTDQVKKMIVHKDSAICADCVIIAMNCLVDSVKKEYEEIEI